MNNNNNENMIDQSVIAIAKSGNKLMAVELRKQSGIIEVIRTKSGEENILNWQEFANECGLQIEPIQDEQTENQKASVVGYDSSGTAFSRVDIPAVEDKEIEAMVKLQAESRLPLPADQMELAWRADRAKNGQLAITIAAARSNQVQNFINKIISFKPANIFLDCEGIVKTWKEVFSGKKQEQDAIIINANSRNTQICLVHKGNLINAVALDMGIEDFVIDQDEDQIETTERFVQDTISVVDLFGFEESEELPVFVLSDGSETYAGLVSSLKQTGLNAILACPEMSKINKKSNISDKEIFEYRLSIGLALMAIEQSGDELNIFRDLYKPEGEEVQKHWLYSPKISGAIAAVVLLLFITVCYAIDVMKPDAIKSDLEALLSGESLGALVERQTLLKQVEAQRPDLLALINMIKLDEENSRGIMGGNRIQLESFDFKKGKKISITGRTSDNVTLYNFENQLREKPGITEVTFTPMQNRSSSARTTTTAPTTRTTTTATTNNARNRTTGGLGDNSIKFSITFHYGNFTQANRREN